MQYRSVACVALITFLLHTETAPSAEPANLKRRIVFNEDCQVLAEAPADGIRQFICNWLDRELAMVQPPAGSNAATGITTFVMLAACPDICTFETKAGELSGQRFGFKQGPWARGIKVLRDQNTDILKVTVDHLRPKGLEILAAIRMNDTHHRRVSADDRLCPMFVVENPQYVIKQPDGRTNETALDYSHAEVRAHRLAIMRELAENYDLDGLELNFCRWAKHFPRDQGRRKAPIMTQFMGQVRQMLDQAAAKRNRNRLTLGIRVPEGIRECWLAGVDVKTWVDKGWIDFLVVATWNETDPQLPIAEFAAVTKNTDCQVLAMMGNMMGGVWSGPPKITGRGAGQFRDCYAGMLLTTPEARACAANYYADGADGISLWNIGVNVGSQGKFCTPEHKQRARDWINAVTDPAKVYQGPRRYHYLPLYKGIGTRKPPARNYPWYDEGASPLGRPKTQIITFAPDQVGKRQAYRFYMADGRSGEKLDGTMRFRVFHLRPDDQLAVDLNGKPIAPSKIERGPLDAKQIGLPGVAFEISLADCPPFRDHNQLGLTLKTKADRKQAPYMETLDIYVD